MVCQDRLRTNARQAQNIRAVRVHTGCIGQQNSPGTIPTVMGSLGVWTLMDYFGAERNASF